MPDGQMQLVIQQMVECFKQPVIDQFHCTRRMTEAMDSQATFLMSISVRSEAAAKLWSLLWDLQGSCVLQLIGVAYKREGLWPSPWALRLRELTHR